jgi:acylphosphatase
MAGIERLDAVVRGRVQGVGFRYFVMRQSFRLGLTGWVANDASGGVRCVVEGPRDRLDELLASVEVGPSGAQVDGVAAAWSAATGEFDEFRVRSMGHRGD